MQVRLAEQGHVVAVGAVLRLAHIGHLLGSDELQDVAAILLAVHGKRVEQADLIIDEAALRRGETHFLGELVEEQVAGIGQLRVFGFQDRCLVVVLVLRVVPDTVSGD